MPQTSRLKKPAEVTFDLEEPGEFPLIAGRKTAVGSVTVSNDDQNLYVEFSTENDWSIAETHLQVGESLDDFPLAGRQGNPVPGKFDYKDRHDPLTTSYEYTIPLGDWEPGDVLMIAAHASVERWVDGEPVQQEGAWGAGERFTTRGNWAMYSTYTVEDYGVLLQNSLSSAAAVENSEVGPAGTIVGNVNFNHDVMSGKGLTPNSGYAGSGVDFPTTIVDTERGAIEMWVKFYYVPKAYSYGVFGFVNVNHWSHNVMVFAWHNSNSRLYFGLRFNGAESGVELANFHPALDTPVHLACVWDREGIAGSDDYMRIYVDGALVASNNTDNGWGDDNTSGNFRIAAPWDNDFGTDRYTVADLKIWDHAKTDF